MKTIRIKGRAASKGYAKGEALVTKDMFAFGGTPELETGIVKEINHEIYGQNVAGKILVYPTGKGSTGDPYSCYFLMKHGNAPKAIINRTANPTTVVSAILANIPMMYSFEKDPLDVIKSGDIVEVNANEGFILINKN